MPWYHSKRVAALAAAAALGAASGCATPAASAPPAGPERRAQPAVPPAPASPALRPSAPLPPSAPSPAQPALPPPRPPRSDVLGDDPAERVLAAMSLEEKIGQLVIAYPPGGDGPIDLGGVILLGRILRDPEAMRARIEALQRRSRIPLLI